jgi:hypothetical protein
LKASAAIGALPGRLAPLARSVAAIATTAIWPVLKDFS